MVKIPLNEIIKRVAEKASISEDDVKKKIDAKLVQLAGLISQEGAAQIVANELGVKLVEESTGMLQIKNVFAGMRSVEVAGKVIRIYEAKEFDTGTRKGKVGSVFMGDETGNIRVTFWNDQADNIRKISVDDIVLIKGAYVRENNGRNELHLNDNSDVRVNPDGVSVGEVKVYVPPESTRKQIKDLKEGDQNIELLATVVQVYNPNFFEVCPDCGKRALENACPAHGKVSPASAYVTNVVLDDGTGNVRVAFYRNQLLMLLGINEDKILAVKSDPESFKELTKPILPKVIKVVGKTRLNPLSNALEFTANRVMTNVDPVKEVELMKESDV